MIAQRGGKRDILGVKPTSGGDKNGAGTNVVATPPPMGVLCRPA
jgi:hypothetical protein